ncbi:MAG: hypothetical protein Q9182_007390 [Xanthomendoza sp. 2 TL-2023]
MRSAAAYGTQDIVFNSKTGLWACCYGSGVQDCAHPIDITFQAPPPNDLKGTFQAPFPGEEPGYSSLSEAAKAGIGVGATLAALVLTAILYILLRWVRRRKQTVHLPAAVISKQSADGTPSAAPLQELYARQQAELDSRARHEAEALNRVRSYEVA